MRLIARFALRRGEVRLSVDPTAGDVTSRNDTGQEFERQETRRSHGRVAGSEAERMEAEFARTQFVIVSWAEFLRTQLHAGCDCSAKEHE